MTRMRNGDSVKKSRGHARDKLTTTAKIVRSLNILLNDQVAEEWADAVHESSPVFRRTLRASITFYVGAALAIICIFAFFFVSLPLTLRQTFDAAEIRRLAKLGADNRERVGLACPCSVSTHSISTFGTIDEDTNLAIPLLSQCAIFSGMSKLGEGEVSPVVQAILEICHASREQALASTTDIGAATLSSPLAFSENKLEDATKKKVEDLRASLGRSWGSALRLSQFHTLVDGADSCMFLRLMDEVEAGCNSHTYTHTHTHTYH